MDPSACTVHRLVADVAVLAGDEVLLVRYEDASKYDGEKGWFLPDDFLAYAEHPRDAAARILQEQTGVNAGRPEPAHIESFSGGPSGTWHLIFHHVAELPRPLRPRLGRNVADAKWFPIDRLPPKKEVAHGGWARDVLAEIRKGR